MDEIRESFRKGNTLTKLIYINLGVFVVALFMRLISAFAGTDVVGYLMLPSDLGTLFLRPWTIITYMFLHQQFLHILFNLLWLFWFGRIFLRYLNEKQLLTTYLIGGIAGGALFMLAYYLFPELTVSRLLGASAAVSAIVFAIAFFAPNHTIQLFFLGEVKIKHLAIAFFILDILMIFDGSGQGTFASNAGGQISHIGGAIYGYLFAVQLRRGKDMGKGFGRFMDALVSMLSRKPKMKVTYKSNAKNMTDEEYNKEKAASQKEVDKILDKIAKSGYDSLSKKEKETLFKMSNKK